MNSIILILETHLDRGSNANSEVVLDHLKQIISRLDKSVIPLLATQRTSLPNTGRSIAQIACVCMAVSAIIP